MYCSPNGRTPKGYCARVGLFGLIRLANQEQPQLDASMLNVVLQNYRAQGYARDLAFSIRAGTLCIS